MSGDITKIKLNKSGIRDLLQSNEVMTELRRQAAKRGTIAFTYVGTRRAHVRYKEGAGQSVDRDSDS